MDQAFTGKKLAINLVQVGNTSGLPPEPVAAQGTGFFLGKRHLRRGPMNEVGGPVCPAVQTAVLDMEGSWEAHQPPAWYCIASWAFRLM